MKITQRTHPELLRMMRGAFPDYRGRTYRVDVTDRPLYCADTYWDGGTRSEYVFLRLSSGARWSPGDPIAGGFAPHANAALNLLRAVAMPAGIVCVRHHIFCGRDMGLRLFVRPEDVNPHSLPEAAGART